MKITFVTKSHTLGDDETFTVDVVRQRDFNETKESVGKLGARLAVIAKKLTALEKSMAQFDLSLSSVDTRLRDDCKGIFTNLIKESLAPVFAVMRQVATVSDEEVPTMDGEKSKVEKLPKKPTRKVSVKSAKPIEKETVNAAGKQATVRVAKKTTTKKKLA